MERITDVVFWFRVGKRGRYEGYIYRKMTAGFEKMPTSQIMSSRVDWH